MWATCSELGCPVLLWLCLGMGSLGHGDGDWFLSGLVSQIDKMEMIKPAMNS